MSRNLVETSKVHRALTCIYHKVKRGVTSTKKRYKSTLTPGGNNWMSYTLTSPAIHSSIFLKSYPTEGHSEARPSPSWHGATGLQSITDQTQGHSHSGLRLFRIASEPNVRVFRLREETTADSGWSYISRFTKQSKNYVCTQAPVVFTGVVTFKSEKQKLCCFLNKGTVSSFQYWAQKYKRLFFYYVNINSSLCFMPWERNMQSCQCVCTAAAR